MDWDKAVMSRTLKTPVIGLSNVSRVWCAPTGARKKDGLRKREMILSQLKYWHPSSTWMMLKGFLGVTESHVSDV